MENSFFLAALVRLAGTISVMGWIDFLRWFPRWLHLLKSLKRVLRDHKEHLTEDLARNGLAGAATLVAQSSHPFFASWRWHTLADCCASIGKVLPTLKLIAHLLVFLSRARDKSLHEKALEAIRDAKWGPCFAVSVLAWVVKLQKWVTGCECHRSELEQGKHVDCWQNGRLLHLAYDHAMKYLQDSIAEAGTWIRAFFGGHQDLLEEAVGLYRRTLATAKAKIGFMDVVPWLLARLDHGGVRARVLQQRESTPLARHHAITRLYFMPGTDLRRAIDDMTGGNMASCLVTALMRLRLVHLHDSVGEGPHSAASGQSGIDLGLDRGHDAHEADFGRVCEFD